jgi:hypothetical protein
MNTSKFEYNTVTFAMNYVLPAFKLLLTLVGERAPSNLHILNKIL